MRHHIQQEYANTLRDAPWRAMVTLTTPSPRSRLWWSTETSAWLDEVQERHRMNVAWLSCYERQPQLHSHWMLAAPGSIDCKAAEQYWIERLRTKDSQHAKVEPFDPLRGGLRYVLKTWGTFDDEINWSDNLRLFRPSPDIDSLNSRAKRNLRHILAQARANN